MHLALKAFNSTEGHVASNILSSNIFVHSHSLVGVGLK